MKKSLLQFNILTNKIIFVSTFLLCFTPFVQPPVALLMGLIIAIIIGNPFIEKNKTVTNYLLKISVVGLGFGINFNHAIEVGKDGLFFTVFSILFTFLAGWIIAKWLNIDKKTAFLISSGTAICGGSAIAAVSPIVNASEKQISVSIGAVFILNSIALLIFPIIGNWLNLSQHQFGLWSAIAIHDTSSVVGASSKFGQEALQIATTIKLERALWIIPLSIITTINMKNKSGKINYPYFIGFFVLAILINSYFTALNIDYSYFVLFAKKGLTATIFLIGAGLSINTIKEVGFKPFFYSFILWIIISVSSLLIIIKTINL